MVGVIVLLDNLPPTKNQLPGRGNHIFCQDCLLCCICLSEIVPLEHWQQNISTTSNKNSAHNTKYTLILNTVCTEIAWKNTSGARGKMPTYHW